MSSVGLHHAVDAEDSFEKKGQQRNIVFFGEQGVGLIELSDVVGAIVGRQSNAGENDSGAAGFEGGEDLVEVGARAFDS